MNSNTTKEIQLLDTPSNRQVLERWARQDARGARLQRALFSEGSIPESPEISVPSSYSTTTETFLLTKASEIEDATCDQAVLDRMVISKMNSGTSTSRQESAESNFLNTISVIDIRTMFPEVYDTKKNRCGSVPALVGWLKKNQDFTWPKDERGDALREVFERLCANLLAEFPVSPYLLAAVEQYALYDSQHKSEFPLCATQILISLTFWTHVLPGSSMTQD